MAIVYDDLNTSRGKSDFVIPYGRLNANAGYLRHYDNYLYLDFILKTTDRNNERTQAAKELKICERKLEYWRRHPNFVSSVVMPQVEEKKKHWNIQDRKVGN